MFKLGNCSPPWRYASLPSSSLPSGYPKVRLRSLLVGALPLIQGAGSYLALNEIPRERGGRRVVTKNQRYLNTVTIPMDLHEFIKNFLFYYYEKITISTLCFRVLFLISSTTFFFPSMGHTKMCSKFLRASSQEYSILNPLAPKNRNLSQKIADDLPPSTHPILYDYKGNIFLYRGLSVPINQLENNMIVRLLDVDHHKYNTIPSREQRIAEINKEISSNGYIGLANHQAQQGREQLTHRLTLAVTEDLAQFTHLDRHRITDLKGNYTTSMLRMLVEIRPDPTVDPILLVRTVAPERAQKEAGLFFPPEPDQVKWYMGLRKKGISRLFEVLNMTALQSRTKHWERQASIEREKTDNEIILEDLPNLIQWGLVKEDLTLNLIAEFSQFSIFVDRYLRDLYKFPQEPEFYLTGIHKSIEQLRILTPKMKSVKDDQRVQHALTLLSQRIENRIEQLPREFIKKPEVQAVLYNIFELTFLSNDIIESLD